MFDAGYRMLGAVAQGWSHIWGYWYFFRQSWRKELTPLKRPWCWERLRAGGERDDRGWDGWMASLTQWHGFCVDSGTWWWTGRPGVLQFMGLKRVKHDWATKLNWVKETSEYYQLQVLHLGVQVTMEMFHNPLSVSTNQWERNLLTSHHWFLISLDLKWSWFISTT